mgnify:CR=1 FL=1
MLKVELSEQQLSLLFQFLRRVNLNAQEVPVFNDVVNAFSTVEKDGQQQGVNVSGLLVGQQTQNEQGSQESEPQGQNPDQ